MPYDIRPLSNSHDRGYKRKKYRSDFAMERNQFLDMIHMARENPLSERGRGRDYMLFVIQGNLGLRPGEVLCLQKKHFKNLSDSMPLAKPPRLKKRSADIHKEIYVHPKVALAIKRYIGAEISGNFLFPGNGKTRISVHGNKKIIFRGHLSMQHYGRIFSSYVRACGFEESYSPHCLRHMYGTIAWAATRDRVFLRDQLGHEGVEGVSSATNTYMNLDREMIKKYIDAVGYML